MLYWKYYGHNNTKVELLHPMAHIYFPKFPLIRKIQYEPKTDAQKHHVSVHNGCHSGVTCKVEVKIHEMLRSFRLKIKDKVHHGNF